MTETEQLAAEAKLALSSCPECGATDWLAEDFIDAEQTKVIVRCDDCMDFATVVRLG